MERGAEGGVRPIPSEEIGFIAGYLAQVQEVARQIDAAAVERLVQRLIQVRAAGGRLFILGVGGSAGNASHAANDFRKIAGFEAYAPMDNVSELTARINDEGWDTCLAYWLRGSRMGPSDAVLVFSVGGGDEARGVSRCLVQALKYAKQVGAATCGIVGRDGGYTALVADECVIVPTVNAGLVTAHAESFQAVIWHGIVCHPQLMTQQTRWESLAGAQP